VGGTAEVGGQVAMRVTFRNRVTEILIIMAALTILLDAGTDKSTAEITAYQMAAKVAP